LEKARELARAMVTLGNNCGVNTRALLTNMDTPIGRAAGNWLEVKEAVACLEGRGSRVEGEASVTSASADDLRELVLTCAAHLLVQSGKSKSLDDARQQAQACLESGAARKKWDEMLMAQGADLEALHRKLALDYMAPVVIEVKASQSGFVSRCDARLIGEVVRDLGGGRLTKESVINYDVGVDRLTKLRESVSSGAILGRIHAADAGQAKATASRLMAAFEFSQEPPAATRLVEEVIIFGSDQ